MKMSNVSTLNTRGKVVLIILPMFVFSGQEKISCT